MVRLFFEVDKTLDMISSAAPGASEKIDKIKSQLHDVMTFISEGGANGNGQPGGGNSATASMAQPY